MNPIGAFKAVFSSKSQSVALNNRITFTGSPYPQDSFARNDYQCETPFFPLSLTRKTKKQAPILRNGERLVPNTVYKLENVSGINLGGECRLVLNGPNVRRQLDRLQPNEALMVGRNPDSNILIPSNITTASRQHLIITRQDDGNLYVSNISQSQNPTYVSNLSLEDYGNNIFFRTFNNNGDSPDYRYISNNKEAIISLKNSLYSGRLTRSYEDYVNAIQVAHQLCTYGADGKKAYYADKRSGEIYKDGGQIRKPGYMVNTRTDSSIAVGKIALERGYNYSPYYNSSVQLKGISSCYLPINECKFSDNGNIKINHYYPAGESLGEYFNQMHKTLCEVKKAVDSNKSEDKILSLLARHYQYAANARPFRHINNSLFMNEINVMLEYAGLPPMLHGELLDHAAQRLQPNDFNDYFIHEYKNNLNLLNGKKARN